MNVGNTRAGSRSYNSSHYGIGTDRVAPRGSAFALHWVPPTISPATPLPIPH